MTCKSQSLARPALLLAASGLALTLAGCKVDNRPLLARMSGSAPPPAYAGAPQPGLPPEAPAYQVGGPNYGAQPYPIRRLPPERAYPYAERAYGLDRAFYQEPPDYAFAYDGSEPWVWEAADDSLMFAEPYGDDYRFYYYEPGGAYPYFVRDADYGYAYGENGVLLALFDAAGALLSADDYDRYYPTARQYWSRGYDLYGAYGRAPRYGVDQRVWAERGPRIGRFEQTWLSAPDRQPAWRQWRSAAGPAALQRYAERPGRALAAEGRADNGLHLGWDRGRRAGADRQDRRAYAASAPPRAVDHGRMAHDGARAGHSERFAQHSAHEQRFARHGGRPSAPSAEAHGRNATFRGPDSHTAFHAAPSQHGGGRGHGAGGGADFARSAPAPHGGGGGREWNHGGGGGHGGHAQPQQFAQQGGHGGDHGGGWQHGGGGGGGQGGQPHGHGGGGGGHGQDKGGGGGGQHGHGHGH